MLDTTVFQALVDLWGEPGWDLFASRLNKQVENYASWKPDPDAKLVNAFTANWNFNVLVYIFPPFNLLGRVLTKIDLDQCEAIVIVPMWTTQPWFAKLLRLLTDCPFILPRTSRILQHPSKDTMTLPKMTLLACRLSGRDSDVQVYRHRLLQSSCPHGDPAHVNNTGATYGSGWNFALHGLSVHTHRL